MKHSTKVIALVCDIATPQSNAITLDLSKYLAMFFKLKEH